MLRDGLSAAQTVALTVAILTAATLGAEAVVAGLTPRSGATATALFLLVMQGVIISATLAAAIGMGLIPDLRLGPSRRRFLDLILWPLAMVTAFGGFGFALALLFPDAILPDLVRLRPLLLAESWPLSWLAIGIGAPLAEELLFRGLMFGGLARSRLGPRWAALFSTLAWTALHLGYSPVGLAAVFAAGLFLSLCLWRTGSLRVPIVCHAVYNCAVLAVLVWLPDAFFASVPA